MRDLQQSVFRILNSKNETVGTGFLVAPQIIVTCAHVVLAAGAKPGEHLYVKLYANTTSYLVEVLKEHYSPQEAYDVAYLQLEALVPGSAPLPLAPSRSARPLSYFTSLGFRRSTVADEFRPAGVIQGVITNQSGIPQLQIEGNTISAGMSGAPVLDQELDCVIGMITWGWDDTYGRIAYAVTTETLVVLHPDVEFSKARVPASTQKPTKPLPKKKSDDLEEPPSGTVSNNDEELDRISEKPSDPVYFPPEKPWEKDHFLESDPLPPIKRIQKWLRTIHPILVPIILVLAIGTVVLLLQKTSGPQLVAAITAQVTSTTTETVTSTVTQMAVLSASWTSTSTITPQPSSTHTQLPLTDTLPVPTTTHTPPSETPAPTHTPTRTFTFTQTTVSLTATPTTTSTQTPTSELSPISTPATRGPDQTKDGMTQILIPAGNFVMGLNAQIDPNAPGNNHPEHTVYLDAFLMDQTEVTTNMYAAFLNDQAKLKKKAWTWLDTKSEHMNLVPLNGAWQPIAGKSNHPVVMVTWQGAYDYCEWAGRRLPTEAEWEKAARGTAENIFPWGNTFSCSKGNFDDESVWSGDLVTGGLRCDGYDETAPVGSFPQGASSYGILDMAGNVAEWVNDWYNDRPQDFSMRDPTGPESGQLRVIRGGSWLSREFANNSAYRMGREPNFRTFTMDIGFRCAMDK